MKKGFSLIELIITIVIISVVMAALAPSINKRLINKQVALDTKLTDKCSGYGFDGYCKLCWSKNNCVVCTKGCLANETLNIQKCSCE